ncbi:hypothetical protein DZF91_09030 [Actinomadura logoneensis]|uniref:Uncharacterized protein n=1 Tax=Actinomadura logoneensis TaxID=2293572 RepID=A0A372JPT2_9ACTN|nr:DUF6463 family protein [Actinomadura logoneensis]RFU41969.1 hypothetical protein DZF91_09030 [Actinomadura logoneensis]
MSGLNRWVPRLIIATAVLHFAWAFLQPNAWDDIVRDGFAAAVADPDAPGHWNREASVWFLIAGALLFVLGTMTRLAVRLTGRVPAQVGWFLLATGVPLCVLYFPVTGSWALLVLGVLALAATYRTEPSPGR